jgi:chemotaxis protein MotA
MLVIIGSIVVIASVLGGFIWAGGHVGALLHPSEILTIGGASLGAAIMMSPKKVLMDLIKGVLAAIKGTPYNRQAYADLFKLSYELLRAARRDGLLTLENHISNPSTSAIFEKYPSIRKNHHVLEFICDGFAPLIDGNTDTNQIRELLDTEIQVIADEHHAAVGILQKTADALPGFGIVAAVLGIVITMGAITGPVEEIGHKVGAALVGTFLGILASYGFFAPLAGRMEFLSHNELMYFRTIASVVTSACGDMNPKVAIELARRGVGSEFRPRRDEMDAVFKDAEGT